MTDDLLNFCEKYNIPKEILNNYIDYYFIGDKPSADTYKIIMEDCCPNEKISEMRDELDTLATKYTTL